MQNYENVQRVRHDILIFLFIALSLTLTVCDPLERGGFLQEKPDKKKAEDDVTSYVAAIKLSMTSSHGNSSHNHLAMKLKRTDLFAEVDRLLDSLPSSKDKKWLKSFLQKLKLVTMKLEKIINLQKNFKRKIQHLVSPKDIFDTLHSGEKEETALFFHNKNLEDKMKFTDAGMTDRQGIQRLGDSVLVDQNISHSKIRKISHQGKQQLLKLKLTDKNPNIFQNQYFHPGVTENKKQNGFNLTSKQGKEENPRNGARYFQTKKSLDHKKFHGNETQQHQHSKDLSRAFKQILTRSRRKNYNRYRTSADSQQRLRPFSPYLYLQKWKKKLSLNRLSEGRLSVLTHQTANKQTDSQLSDEMKRELHDGKIIILSDSVVRSNFEPNYEEKHMEKQTELSQNPENIETRKK